MLQALTTTQALPRPIERAPACARQKGHGLPDSPRQHTLREDRSSSQERVTRVRYATLTLVDVERPAAQTPGKTQAVHPNALHADDASFIEAEVVVESPMPRVLAAYAKSEKFADLLQARRIDTVI